jgi:hypothetical protein
MQLVCVVAGVRKQTLALSIVLNWVGSTWRWGQNAVLETQFEVKDRTMDNVHNCDSDKVGYHSLTPYLNSYLKSLGEGYRITVYSWWFPTHVLSLPSEGIAAVKWDRCSEILREPGGLHAFWNILRHWLAIMTDSRCIVCMYICPVPVVSCVNK